MMTERELAILPRTFLFAGVAPEELDALLADTTAERRRFSKNGVIYAPDDYRRELGIILSGRVLVTKGNLVVSELTAGELFGAAALYNEDAGKAKRKSHENAEVKALYDEFLGAPNSHKAHELLHTTYTARPKYKD